MDKDLAQKAIAAALSGDWNKAAKINRDILQIDPKNTDALNRLARAYAELGKMVKARKTSNEVIKIDPFDKIARKCLERWKGLKNNDSVRSGATSGDAFIEEPGKTKITPLMHLGASKNLARLDSGDEVKINLHGHRVSITTIDGEYIGKLPDDLGAKIKKLIKMGNEYLILIKSIDPKNIKVFIKETKCSPTLSDVPSFTSEKIDYISFTPPELVHKKDDMFKDLIEEE